MTKRWPSCTAAIRRWRSKSSRDRSSAQLLRDFMRDFVRQQEEAAAHDAWFRRQVQVGLDAANAGDVIAAAEVEAEAEAWRAEVRRKLASSPAES